jgi:translation initiation factor IF-3
VKEIGQVESPPLQDGRNMVMVLGPTKNAGVAKDDAKDEDTQRGEEAVQAELDGQADAPPAPPDYAPGPPGEEQPREAEAGAAGRAGRV